MCERHFAQRLHVLLAWQQQKGSRSRLLVPLMIQMRKLTPPTRRDLPGATDELALELGLERKPRKPVRTLPTRVSQPAVGGPQAEDHE